MFLLYLYLCDTIKFYFIGENNYSLAWLIPCLLEAVTRMIPQCPGTGIHQSELKQYGVSNDVRYGNKTHTLRNIYYIHLRDLF